MQYYLTVTSYTCLGEVIATLQVRTDSPEGSIATVLSISTQTDDDGDDDPYGFAQSALVSLLERL